MKPPAISERDERDEACGARPRFDFLEVVLATKGDTRLIQESFVGARSKRVPERDQDRGSDQFGNTLSQPAGEHAQHLRDRADDQTRPMAESIGEPSGWEFQTDQREISRRENHRDDGRRDSPLPHPPEQIETVHHAFDTGDVIRQVERQVTAEVSIGRHETRVTEPTANCYLAVVASDESMEHSRG